MKKLILPLASLLFMAACDDEPESNVKVPFTNYTFESTFDFHFPQNKVQTVTLYSGVGSQASPAADEYQYKIQNSGPAIPANGQLTASVSSQNVTIEFSGTMTRTGDKVPSSFAGNPDLWAPVSCGYNIKVVANFTSKVVLLASLELHNGKFTIEEDIKDLLIFTKNGDFVWLINSAGTVPGLNYSKVAVQINIKQ